MSTASGCLDFRLLGCILGLFARGVLRFLSSGVHFWLSQSRSASNDTPKGAFLMLLLGLDFLRFDPGVFFAYFFCIPFFKMARFASVMYRGTWWGDFCSPTGLWKERCVLGIRKPGKYNGGRRRPLQGALSSVKNVPASIPRCTWR